MTSYNRHQQDMTEGQQYAEEKALRDDAWRERNQWCGCSEPVPTSSYLRMWPCKRCGLWIHTR